ncbi:MAG: hypothetical protein QM767_26305 [Anaeromyxobacter sp.]
MHPLRRRPPPRPRPTAAALAALAAAALAGCAGGTAGKMTFADAGFPGRPEGAPAQEPAEAAAPPPVQVAAPEAEPTEAPQGPPIDPVLQRFAAEARLRRAHGRARAFPPEAVEAWQALLPTLDGWLARPLPQTPLLELVRVRVTLEAEWTSDTDRLGAAPPGLEQAVGLRLGRVATRMATARALGQALVATTPPPGRLRWPVEAGISSPFGLRVDPLHGTRRMHRGLDLAADEGRVVRAAAPGWVVRAGHTAGHGLMVDEDFLRFPEEGETLLLVQLLGGIGNGAGRNACCSSRCGCSLRR